MPDPYLWYTTRDAVKSSLDAKETARNNTQVDRAIESASRAVEGELGRLFYPKVATFSFPAPGGCRLYLDKQVGVDLVAATSISVGGTVLASSAYTLLPVDGPPYNVVEFDTAPAGAGRPVSITGLWGYDNVTAQAGTLAAAVSSTSATTLDVSDGSDIGVGSLLTVGTERMTVTGRSMLDTTQNLAGALTANVAARVVGVADGTAYHTGEVLLVDEERLLVVDIAGDDLIVRRAWDGSVLTAHDNGTDIYALRRLTVERGVLGTTAATHLIGAAVARQVYPGPVVAYTVALAQQSLMQEVTGQQQAPGGHTFGTTISAERDRAVAACGRESGFA